MDASIPLLVLTVVNLVILLGVVRRLNQLGAQPRSGPPVAAAPSGSPAVAPGRTVGDFVATATGGGDFVATATGGEPISAGALNGRTLVALFTVHCRLCEALKPRFRAYARAFDGGRAQVLAVIVAPRREHPELGPDLADVAQVVIEPIGGPVSTAFGVDAYPEFLLLNDRVVLAVGAKLEALPGIVASAAAA